MDDCLDLVTSNFHNVTVPVPYLTYKLSFVSDSPNLTCNLCSSIVLLKIVPIFRNTNRVNRICELDFSFQFNDCKVIVRCKAVFIIFVQYDFGRPKFLFLRVLLSPIICP